MITGAAICPPAPVLARELTGRDPVLPELREACAAVTARLLGSRPDVIVVVGAADRTAGWPAGGRLGLAAFAPAFAPSAGTVPATEAGAGAAGRAPDEGRSGTRAGAAGPVLPVSLGLGARLLDEAGYRGPRVLRSVGRDEPPPACLRLGAGLAGPGGRTGLLVMADGSACRTLRAPGYLDPRAAGFDAALERAVRGGDLGPLRTLDRPLARELLATAAPAWQVLAGAMPGRAGAAEVRYAGAPLGVFYLAGWLAGADLAGADTGRAATPAAISDSTGPLNQ